MRPLVWAPVVLLCAVAGVLGWQWGLAAMTVDEGDAIAAIAERHVAAVPGAVRSDCAATPGAGAVWLVVACTTDGRTRAYRLDRQGRLMEEAGL